MDFSYSENVQQLRVQICNFMDSHVIPRIALYKEESKAGQIPYSFMKDLKALAKEEGLWNLFLPGLRDDEPGTRLTNLEYAPLAELMGRVLWSSEVFNCSAPDTGNMEVLHMFATEYQRERWLKPLLEGEIRSAFSMTEPDVASSDATNIQTSIIRDGDEYVINGRKWFTSGASDPRCKVLVVMGKTSPEAERHRQQSMILVPKDTPGVEIIRNVDVMNHTAPEGHNEIVYRDVRVPAANMIASEGDGFMIAQARLGPGRVHHAMRAIGQAEVALELMIERSLERKAFGQYLNKHGVVAEWIARSRMEIDQARFLVLNAAWMMDTVGAKGAATEIAMIKVVAPNVLTSVTDRAIQTFGAMGVTSDSPLADSWSTGRWLRIADGPDEVHMRSVAREAIKRHQASVGDKLTSLDFLTPPNQAKM